MPGRRGFKKMESQVRSQGRDTDSGQCGETQLYGPEKGETRQLPGERSQPPKQKSFLGIGKTAGNGEAGRILEVSPAEDFQCSTKQSLREDN